VRTYETVFILDPDLSEEDTEKAIKRVQTVIEGQKGKVLLWDRWGKRKLAYRVKKKVKGNYIRVVYHGEPKVVAIIERNLRIMEDVLKFLTIIMADKEIDITIEEKKEEREAATDSGPRSTEATAPRGGEPDREKEKADLLSEPVDEAPSPTDEQEVETTE
jgi:small subunit ribosomal protein S6